MNVRKQLLGGMVSLLLCALLLPNSGVTKSDNEKAANPGILPPQANACGASYPEWAAKWWQWAVSFPVGSNPRRT